MCVGLLDLLMCICGEWDQRDFVIQCRKLLSRDFRTCVGINAVCGRWRFEAWDSIWMYIKIDESSNIVIVPHYWFSWGYFFVLVSVWEERKKTGIGFCEN